MGRKILANAFSLNMLTDVLKDGGIFFFFMHIENIEPEQVPQDCESSWGHEDSARLASGILGWTVDVNRRNDSLTKEDTLFIGQYQGPRLEIGATELPEGAKIQFVKVSFLPIRGWDDPIN